MHERLDEFDGGARTSLAVMNDDFFDAFPKS